MATLTIRNLDDGVKRRLRIRTAEHGRSMADEVRDILRRTLGEASLPERPLGTAIRELFKAAGGIELDMPPRQAIRKPPRFD